MTARRCLSALALVAALGGCGTDAPSPRPPSFDYPACLAALTTADAAFAPLADFTEGDDGCGITGAVRATRLGVTLAHPAALRCDLALALTGYETAVLQPLAQRYFKRDVAALEHMGSYVCRASHNHRLSQHAFGLALDLSGVRLSDGRRIMVATSWADPGVAGRFWHDAAKAACARFSAVLTPDTDADHQSHIHLDLGPYRLCGA